MKALIVIQQCYHCGRDMTRVLDKEEKKDFLEDHPWFPTGFHTYTTQRSIQVLLPEAKCDPCIEAELDWKYGPAPHCEVISNW